MGWRKDPGKGSEQRKEWKIWRSVEQRPQDQMLLAAECEKHSWTDFRGLR